MHKARNSHRLPLSHAGFTLLEMMLVIAIAAVILGIAVPNFREFMLNNRITAGTNDLVAGIHMARSQAIRTHMPTVFCFTSSPNAATPACDGDGSQGWIVFADDLDPAVAAATDSNGQVDGAEVIYLRHGPLAEITLNLAPDDSGAYVAFAGSGFLRPLDALDPPMTSVVVCDHRGNVARGGPERSTARGVILGVTGRPEATGSVEQIDSLGGCP